MECEQVRQALSARIDSEEPRPEWDDDVVDAHLSTCEDCQDWYSRAMSLSRSLRIAPSEPMPELPDFSEQLLASVPESSLPQKKPWAMAGLTLSRIALIVLGICYIAWSVFIVKSSTHLLPDQSGGTTMGAGGAVGDSTDPELSRWIIDAAAFRLALGFGLLWCAWRSRASAGMMPIFVAVWGFSLGFATRDIVLGLASVSQVLGLVLFLLTLTAMGWCWVCQSGITAAAARGTFDSLRARPARTSLSDARLAHKALTQNDEAEVYRQVER